MKEGEDEEDAGCHVAAYRPRIAYLPEIDFERADQEDEGSVGEDDRHLRTDKPGDGKQPLDDRTQHALVVHTRGHLVPRT